MIKYSRRKNWILADVRGIVVEEEMKERRVITEEGSIKG